MNDKNLNRSLMNFIDTSPTPFHVVANLEKELQKRGFSELFEHDSWNIDYNGKYYVKRNDSAMVIINLNSNSPINEGFRLYGSHTDSPYLKVKPNADKKVKSYLQIGVEVYGGGLLNTWFDRDLSLAGRLTYLSKSGKIQNQLIDFNRPVATIPSLAIHLDRTQNETKCINKQKDLPPIICQISNSSQETTFLQILEKEAKNSDLKKILDYEICLYDFQKSSYVGLNNEFIASARLDNLLSCYLGVRALLDSKNATNSILVFNDHEECGSASNIGADGPLLESVLKRLCKNEETYARAMSSSMMISCDNAHAVHPNFSEKHEENHAPLMNSGPVIKINHNQRYSTNSETAAIFAYLCEKTETPFQKFVVRTDMACGSTIGPITTSRLGIKAIDIGLPQWAMHSIRETCGSQDPMHLYKVLSEFFIKQEAF